MVRVCFRPRSLLGHGAGTAATHAATGPTAAAHAAALTAAGTRAVAGGVDRVDTRGEAGLHVRSRGVSLRLRDRAALDLLGQYSGADLECLIDDRRGLDVLGRSDLREGLAGLALGDDRRRCSCR